jgi:hypothetical protein
VEPQYLEGTFEEGQADSWVSSRIIPSLPASYDGPPKPFGQPMFVRIDSKNFPKGCPAIEDRRAGKVLWFPEK